MEVIVYRWDVKMIENILEAFEKAVHNPERHGRNIPRGLFLQRASLAPLTQKAEFFLGLKRKEGRKIVRDEIERITKGVKHYLIEPHAGPEIEPILIWTGHILPTSKPVAGYPVSTGDIISCTKSILPQDPTFANRSEINLYPNAEHTAEFIYDNESFMVHRHAFDRFVQQARNPMGPDRKKIINLGDCLNSFYKLFKNARPVTRKNGVFQALRHGKRTEYRANQNLVFVIENDNVIKTCYEKEKDSFKAMYKEN